MKVQSKDRFFFISKVVNFNNLKLFLFPTASWHKLDGFESPTLISIIWCYYIFFFHFICFACCQLHHCHHIRWLGEGSKKKIVFWNEISFLKTTTKKQKLRSSDVICLLQSCFPSLKTFINWLLLRVKKILLIIISVCMKLK